MPVSACNPLLSTRTPVVPSKSPFRPILESDPLYGGAGSLSPQCEKLLDPVDLSQSRDLHNSRFFTDCYL